MRLGGMWGKITDSGERHPAPASLPGFWTRRWPEKNRKPRTCWETRKSSKGLSWEPRRHPASLSAAASEEDEVVSPRSERVKWLRANPGSAGIGEQKPPVSVSGSPPGAPSPAPRGSPSGCGRNLRCAGPSPAPLRATQNFAHTAANAACLTASRAPPSALDRCLWGFGFGLFPPAASDSHPGGSLAVAGAPHPPCAGLAGGVGAAFQMTTSPGRAAPRGQTGPLCRPCPCPPTPSLPRLSERAQHLLLPSPPAAEDHTLRSALSTHPPAAAGEGEGALLLFPGGGRSVWGQGAQEMPRSWVSLTGDAHSQQLCRQQ